MPISDKVIELETKKTGRNIVFIVLISVLAAASILFAVLWVTKAPAVDPPAIDKISLAQSDMYAEADEGESMLYKVSPGCEYSLNFDLILKEDSAIEDTNSILEIECDKSVIIPTVSSLDPENPLRYIYKFVVPASAVVNTKVQLSVRSAFTPETVTVINIQVVESYAATLDVAADSETNLKTIVGERRVRSTNSQGQTVVTRTPGSTLTLEEKSDSTTLSRHYGVKERTIFYELVSNSARNDKNEVYTLNLEQLGKLGLNGFAKVPQGIEGTVEGGKFDQLRVYVASGWNPADGDYKEIVGKAVTDSTNQVANKFANLDVNPFPSSQYCRNRIDFEATAAGKATVKIVANSYNNSPEKPQVIIDLDFVSSNEIDAVTDIIFTNPYTDRESDEVDFYLDGVGGKAATPFVFDNYIGVIKGGKYIAGSDFKSNGISLSYRLSDANGNPDTNTMGLLRKTSDSTFVVRTAYGTGDAHITISDTNTYGFGTSIVVTVHVRGKVKALTSGTLYELNMDAGKDKSVDIAIERTYDNSGLETSAANNEAILKSLNSTLTVEYPETAVGSAATLPALVFDKDGKITNAADTIVIEGINKNSEVNPDFKAETGAAASSTLKFSAGLNVQQGTYEFLFKLSPQGLEQGEKDRNVYTVAQSIEFKVSISVINLATAFEFKSASDIDFGSYSSFDKYTELENKEDKSAILTVAAGTGTQGANGNYYTSFTLKNLLNFYYANGELVEDDSVDVNYANVSIQLVNYSGTTSSVYNNSRAFLVPRDRRDSVRVKLVMDNCERILTLRYFEPVAKIEITGDSVNTDWDHAKKIYYDASDLAGGEMSLGNGANDGDTFTLYSFAGDDKEIATSLSGLNSNVLNHTDRLGLDIAVMWKESGHILLEKKKIGVTWYYFDPQSSGREEADALFSVGYADISNGHNVRVLKDLYAYSFADKSAVATADGEEADNTIKKNRDFQRFILMYSYKDPYEFGNNPIYPVNERGVINNFQDIKGNAFVACTYYELVRKFDGIEVHKNHLGGETLTTSEASNKDISKNDTYKILYSSGTSFDVWAYGIIDLGNANLGDNGIHKLGFGSSTSYGGHGETLACTQLVFNKHENSGNNLYKTSAGRYRVTCALGEQNKYCGTIVISEVYADEEKTFGEVGDLEIMASNVSIEITDIEILSEDKFVVYKNGGDAFNNYITVQYSVTYASDEEEEKNTLESYAASLGGSDKTLSDLFDFPTDETDFTNTGSFENFSRDGFTVTRTVTYTVKQTAPNGTYSIVISSGSDSISKSVSVCVATVIDSRDFKMTATIGERDYAFGCDPNATVTSIPLTYTGNARKDVYDFVFDFAVNGNLTVDRSLLAFRIPVIDGIDGYYYTSGGNEHLNDGTPYSNADIVGYRLKPTGKKSGTSRLEATVTQQLPANTTVADEYKTLSYTLRTYITVDVPVTDIKLTVSETGGGTGSNKYDAGSTITFTTDGRTSCGDDTDWVNFTLGTIVNENGQKPLNEDCTVELSDSVGMNDVYRLVGNTLSVNYSKVKANAVSLIVKSGGVSKEFILELKTSRMEIRFAESNLASIVTGTAGTRVQNDNALCDYHAYVYNAGTPETISEADITYTVTQISGVTVRDEDGNAYSVPGVKNKFKPVGASGSFAVTAAYGTGDNAISVTVIVTVSVSVNTVNFNSPGITLIVGKSKTVQVTAASAVTGIKPDIDDIALDYDDNIISVTKTAVTTVVQPNEFRWNLAIEPKAAGSIVLTVTAGGVTRNLNITVVDVALEAGPARQEINVLAYSAENIYVPVSVVLNGGNNIYKVSDIQDLKVSIDDDIFGKVDAAVVRISDNGATVQYRLTLPKSKITSAAAFVKNYTIAVSGSLDGVALATTAVFTLSATKTDIGEFTLNQGTNAVTYIDKALEEYKFNYAINLGASVNISYAVCYENGDAIALTIDNNGNFTVGESVAVGRIKVTMTVSAFGGGWVAEKVEYYDIVDSSRISASLYIGNTAGISGSNKNGSTEYIDYKGNAKKIVTLAVDVTSIGAMVGGDDAGKFNVSGADGLTAVGSPAVTTLNGRKYFIASFVADKAGTYTFGVYTDPIGGKIYAPDFVTVTLAAYKPEFVLDKTSITVKTGYAGTSNTVNVNLKSGNAFDIAAMCDSVSYECMTGYDSSLVSIAANGKTFTVTAKNLTAGGGTVAAIKVTVNGGIYDGLQTVLYLDVTVTAAERPAAFAQEYKTYVDGGVKDLYGLVSVSPTGTSYTVSAAAGNNIQVGSLRGTKYTAPTDGAYDGDTVNVNLVVTITSGDYNGLTIPMTVKITVYPNASKITVTDGNDRQISGIMPGETVTFKTTMGSNASSAAVLAGDYNVVYTVLNKNTNSYVTETEAGVMHGNAFTAKSYSGEVTVRAQITYYGGTFAGATYTHEIKFNVNGLVLKSGKTLSAAPGGEFDLADNVFDTVNNTGSYSAANLGSDLRMSGSKITVNPNANFGTANKSVRIKLTVAQGGVNYGGEFDFTITPLAVPSFPDVEVSADKLTYTVSDVAGATFACDGDYSADLISAVTMSTVTGGTRFVVTCRTDTAGGTGRLRITMTVSGAPYTGSIYDGKTFYKDFEVEVEAAKKPTVTLGYDGTYTNDGGKLKVTVSDSTLYEVRSVTYNIVSGSEYITLNRDGSYELIRSANATVKIKAVAGVKKKTGQNAPYDELVLDTNELSITVRPESTGTTGFTAYADYAAGKLIIELNGYYSASYTVSVESNSECITLLPDDKFQLDYDKIFAVPADPKNISIKVEAKTKDSRFSQERTQYRYVTVTASDAVKELPDITGLELDSDSGKVKLTTEGDLSVVYVSSDSEYLKITERGGEYAYDVLPAKSDCKADVTVSYRVTGGIWKGNVIAKVFEKELSNGVTLDNFAVSLGAVTYTDGTAAFVVTYPANGYYEGAIVDITADNGATVVKGATAGTATVTVPQGRSALTVRVSVRAIVIKAPFVGEIAADNGKSATVNAATAAAFTAELTEKSSDGTKVVYELGYECNYGVDVKLSDISASDNRVTVTEEGGKFAVTALRDKVNYDFTVTVGGKLTSGAYAPDAIACTTASRSVSAKPVEFTVTLLTVSETKDTQTVYTFGYESNYAVGITATCANSDVTVTKGEGNTYIVTAARTKHDYSFTVTVSGKVTEGAHSNESVNAITQSVTVSAQEVSFGVTLTEDAEQNDSDVIVYTLAYTCNYGVDVKASNIVVNTVSGTVSEGDVTVAVSGGVIKVTAKRTESDYSFALTVGGVVTDGEHANESLGSVTTDAKSVSAKEESDTPEIPPVTEGEDGETEQEAA